MAELLSSNPAGSTPLLQTICVIQTAFTEHRGRSDLQSDSNAPWLIAPTGFLPQVSVSSTAVGRYRCGMTHREKKEKGLTLCFTQCCHLLTLIMSRKVKTYLLSLPLQSTEQQLVYQFSSVIYLVIYTARTKIIGWLFERLASHFNCRRDKMHSGKSSCGADVVCCLHVTAAL